MTSLREDQGSAVLVAVLLPLVIASLAGVIGIGLLRTTAERVRGAADLAAVIAVNDQDDDEHRRSGQVVLSRDAADVARASFAANLDGIAPLLADGPSRIARDADVLTLARGGVDPATGESYDRPTVRIAARVPVRTFVLGAVALPAIAHVGVHAVAVAR